MGVGRRGRGPWPPLDFEISAKKHCFLSFEQEKTNFTTFVPHRKITENPLVLPPGKNPYHAHAKIIKRK